MDNRPGGKATVRALADALGLSYQAVRKVLIGETNAMTAENNDRAAAWLHVHSRWLATGKGPRHTSEPVDPKAAEPSAAYTAARPHADRWIAEAVRILESMSSEDRRAAVLNLRVFQATLTPQNNGQALRMAA